MEYHPNIQTVIFISIFLLVYLFILIRNAIRNVIDLYDLLLLATVAIIPAIFVFSPGFVSTLSQLLGVAFPLTILFGTLFIIVFIYLYRIIIKINSSNKREVALIQELGLLKKEIQETRNSEKGDKKERPKEPN